MISCVLFATSAACVVAMFKPSRRSGSTPDEIYTYYVSDADPQPTWQRKVPALARIAGRSPFRTPDRVGTR